MESQMSHRPQSYKWNMEGKSNHDDRYQLSAVESVQKKLKLDNHHFLLANDHLPNNDHIDHDRRTMFLRSYANHQQKRPNPNLSSNHNEGKHGSQNTANNRNQVNIKNDVEMKNTENRTDSAEGKQRNKQSADQTDLSNNSQEKSPETNKGNAANNRYSLFVNNRQLEDEQQQQSQVTDDKGKSKNNTNKSSMEKTCNANETEKEKPPSDQNNDRIRDAPKPQDQILLRHQQNHKDDTTEKSFVPFVRQKNKIDDQSPQLNKINHSQDVHINQTANNKRLIDTISQDTHSSITDMHHYRQNKTTLPQNRLDLIDPRLEQEILNRNIIHSQLANNNTPNLFRNIDPAILQHFYANYQLQLASNNNNHANPAAINGLGQHLHGNYLSPQDVPPQQAISLHPALTGHPNIMSTDPYLKAQQINGISELNALQELEYQRYLAMLYPSLLHRREGENVPINHPLMRPDLSQFSAVQGELLSAMQQHPLAAVNGTGPIPNGIPPDIAAQLQYSYLVQQAAINNQRNSTLHPYVQNNMESEILLELERQRQLNMRHEYTTNNNKTSKIDEQLSRLQREEMLWMKKQQQIKEEKLRKQQQRQQLINSNYKQTNKDKKENNMINTNSTLPNLKAKATVEDQVNDNSCQNPDKNQTNTSGKYFTPSSPETKVNTFTVGEIMGLKESLKNKNGVDDVNMTGNSENKQIPCPEEEEKRVAKDSKCLLLQYINSTTENKGSSRKRKSTLHSHARDGTNKKINFMAKLGLVPCSDEKVIREEFEVKRNKRRLKAMEASLANGRIRNRKLRKGNNHNQKQRLTSKSKSMSNQRKLVVKVDFARRSSPDISNLPESTSSSDGELHARSPYMPITEPITPPDASSNTFVFA